MFQNRTQKDFKKQMDKAIKEENQKARQGKGIFTNKLFKLRFYGYDYEPSKKGPSILRVLLNIILFIIKIAFFIAVFVIVLAAAALLLERLV